MKYHTLALRILLPIVLCCGCAASPPRAPSMFDEEVSAGVEEVRIHRTVRVSHLRGSSPACAAAPFPVANEDVYDLWSLTTRPADSRVVKSHVERVGTFRACIGALELGHPLNMYTMTTLKDMSYTGLIECNQPKGPPPLRTLLPLSCLGSLSDLPPEYSGGMVVSSTLAPLISRDQPVDAHVRGYLSTSVLVVRLWKKPKE